MLGSRLLDGLVLGAADVDDVDELELLTESRSKYLMDLIRSSIATPFDGLWLNMLELLIKGPNNIMRIKLNG